jgi:hypothetical protein
MTLPADNAVIVGSTPTLLAFYMAWHSNWRRLNSHEDVFLLGELPSNDMTTRSEPLSSKGIHGYTDRAKGQHHHAIG